MNNYYEILGVSEDATQRDIKKAYQSKSLAIHPDKNSKCNVHVKKILEDNMSVLNEAHTTLGDPLARVNYDDKLQRERRRSASADSNTENTYNNRTNNNNNNNNSTSNSAKKRKSEETEEIREKVWTVKIYSGDVFVPSAMAMATFAELIKKKAIAYTGSCLISEAAVLQKTTGLLSTVCTRYALIAEESYTTNAPIFVSVPAARSTLHAVCNISVPMLAQSYVEIQERIVEFKNAKVKKEELALIVFKSTVEHDVAIRSANTSAIPTAPSTPTCSVMLIVGGILHGGVNYVEVKGTASASSASHYHKEPLRLAAPATYEQIIEAVQTFAQSIAMTFDRDTHMVLKATGDIINIAKSGAKIHNMRRCDEVEFFPTLESGEAVTVAVLPRNMADSAIACVGGSKAASTVDRAIVIGSLRFNTVRDLQMGNKPAYLQHVRFIDSNAQLRNATVEVLLKRAAETVGGVLTKERLIAAVQDLPQQSLPAGVQLLHAQQTRSAPEPVWPVADTQMEGVSGTSISPTKDLEYLRHLPCEIREPTLCLRKVTTDATDLTEIVVCTWPQLQQVLLDKVGRETVQKKVQVQVQGYGVRLARPGEWICLERITSDTNALVLYVNEDRCKCTPDSILREVAETPEEAKLPTPDD